MFLAAALAAESADAQVFEHRAVTVRTALQQGAVRAGAENWKCKADTCAHVQEMDGSRYTKEIYRHEGRPILFESGDDWEITFDEPVFGD